MHFNQFTLLASLGDRGRRYQVTKYSLLLFHPVFMDRTLQFLDGLLFLSALFLLHHLIRAKTFIGAVPLAPAICGAVIWCAR